MNCSTGNEHVYKLNKLKLICDTIAAKLIEVQKAGNEIPNRVRLLELTDDKRFLPHISRMYQFGGCFLGSSFGRIKAPLHPSGILQ